MTCIESDISSDEDETLEDVLRNRLVESVFDRTPRLFLPREALNEVVTRSAVLVALEINTPTREDDELVRFILQDAKKIFATTIFVGVRPLRRAMHLFRSNNFDDRMLPLNEVSNNCISMHPFVVMENGSVGLKKRVWTQARIMNFHDHQWKLLAHVFSIPESNFDLEKQNLGEQTVPFVKRINRVREGSFGSLVPYAIHPDHIQYPPDRHRVDIIAVKRISLDASSQENRIQQWLTESKAAVTVNALNQDHIVRFITAFRRLEGSCLVEHYFVSEWADGGDLTDMWTAIPRPVFTPELMSAFARQLLGVARALAAVHELRGEEMFHGSLKPSRIFWFRYGNEFGRLKIGGWGKVPSNLCLVRYGETTNVQSSSTSYLDRHYSAPELATVHGVSKPGYFRNVKALRSLQANDMWALGCIIFECMIWLLEGSDEIKRFRRQSSRFPSSGSPFYEYKSARDSPSTKVHTVVIRRLDEMAQKTADTTDSEALGGILYIIRSGLLVIDEKVLCLPECYSEHCWQASLQRRLSADKFVARLEALNGTMDLKSVG